MSTWLLIVISVSFAHGLDYRPEIAFQVFESKSQCFNKAKLIETQNAARENSHKGNTSARCVERPVSPEVIPNSFAPAVEIPYSFLPKQ